MQVRHSDILIALLVLISSVTGLLVVDDASVTTPLYAVATAAASFLVGAFRPKPGGLDEAHAAGELDLPEGDDGA